MADYRLAFDVERCIEQDGIARQLPEFGDEAPVARIDLPSHGLGPGGTVGMYNGWNVGFFPVAGIEGCDHERLDSVLHQIIWGGLDGQRRTERSKCFTVFYAFVDDVLVLPLCRAHQDRTIAQPARPTFHSPLKPGEDLVLRQQPG